METISLAIKLPLDYASFNIVSPRFGTNFRKTSINKGIVDQTNLDAESSAAQPVWKNQQLTNTELSNLRRKAVRKFYLRPFYIFKRIRGISTRFELYNIINEGFALLKKNK